MSRSRLTRKEGWRVLVTREEGADGPLSRALENEGFVPVVCPLMTEQPPGDMAAVERMATELEQYDWVMCSSARSVRALVRARSGKPWPKGLKSAAVGEQTAESLLAMGADPKPVVARTAGAESLWIELKDRDAWLGKRVLIPTVRGGRPDLIRSLVAAGARVDDVEAYRMLPLPRHEVAERFALAEPDAVVLASPSVAHALFEAIGLAPFGMLRAVVAIGDTTAEALRAHGIEPIVPNRTGLVHVAKELSRLREAQRGT